MRVEVSEDGGGCCRCLFEASRVKKLQASLAYTFSAAGACLPRRLEDGFERICLFLALSSLRGHCETAACATSPQPGLALFSSSSSLSFQLSSAVPSRGLRVGRLIVRTRFRRFRPSPRPPRAQQMAAMAVSAFIIVGNHETAVAQLTGRDARTENYSFMNLVVPEKEEKRAGLKL
uniref:Uncharacterized protein n=1 Tax=Pristionchus pacificus TaxID=54126 RepID=A0A2A6CY47_PRIPA|eukprot:PDM83016.1 hypothetical protein PRIPAC_37409 [Pristionchus pacificus]